MRVFGQSIGICPEPLTIRDQTKPVRDHDVTRPRVSGDLVLDGLLDGFSEDLDRLTVLETILFRVVRVHDGCASPFSFVPSRISHPGVGIVIHVSPADMMKGNVRLCSIRQISEEFKIDFVMQCCTSRFESI
jgi:hypothetical protein